MPDTSRREFATGGGGAVTSGSVLDTLVVGWGDAPYVTTRGRGRWTRFGTVAVLGVSRRVLTPSCGAVRRRHRVRQVNARHRNASETVRVDVEIHNGSDRQIPVSPGQFRLRVGGAGPTLSPSDAGWSAGPLGASETVAGWISYQAPPGALDLWLEYAEPGATAPQAFVIRPGLS